MKGSVSELGLHGAIGGLLAGGVVAVWFLIVDVVTSEALLTPRLLAAIVFGEEVAGDARLVAGYTALHFGVFALLGAVTALGLRAVGLGPGWLAAVLYGLGLLNAVHYSVLWLTGSAILTVLPPFHVLAANLAGGFALTTYLHRTVGSDRLVGSALLRRQRMLADGVVTGLVGAGAVAAWFLVVDAGAGEPLRTPAALGSTLFFGASGPSEVRTGVGIVAAYTFGHLVAFAAAGTAFVVVARQIERRPSLWLFFALFFVTVEALFVATAAVTGTWVLGLLGAWAVTVANLLAVAAMGLWVWRHHPALRQALHEPLATRV